MAFDFASVKTLVRRTVHDTLGVPAVYTDATVGTQTDLKVRFHTKIDRFGDMLEQGWAEVIEGVNRVIFDRDELSEKGVTLTRGGKVTLTSEGYEHVSLVLHAQEPNSGSVETIWQVSQE